MTKPSVTKKDPSRKDVYADVTSAILEQLEAGVVPWHKPWASGQMPTSMSTNKPYRGINAFLLTIKPYASPWWGTYKQIGDLGGQVRKGEKGTPVVFWKRLTVPTSAEEKAAGRGNVKVIPMLKHFVVFNADQADDLPAKYTQAAERGEGFDPVAEAEAILSGYSGCPEITYGGDRAYYAPKLDAIQLPQPESFESADSYYSTAFHEMTHSTGHASRLKRPTLLESHHFGDENYSKEELVAEMGAAMLAGIAGISNVTVPQSAAYVASWLKALRGDPKMVVQAAGQAQKAADFILGVTYSDDAAK